MKIPTSVFVLFQKYVFYTLAFSLLLSSATFVFANDKNGVFPNVGLLFMSGKSNYSGSINLTSNNCNVSETNAYAKIKSSTKGTTEMKRWLSGINMRQSTCTGNFDTSIDIKLNYLTNYTSYTSHGIEGGHTHGILASKTYCGYWGLTYPCGTLPEIHLNKPKWDLTSTIGRERLLIHETGHAHGLAHHCSGDSIMNDGTSGCNGGKWSAVMSYQPTDRVGISAIYP